MENPLADLLNAVASLKVSDDGAEVAHARPDFNREDRKGVPEVIYAGSKTPEQAIRIAEAFLEARGRAILSRVSPELEARLAERFAGLQIERYPLSQMVVLRRPEQRPPRTGGRVGVVTAGT